MFKIPGILVGMGKLPTPVMDCLMASLRSPGFRGDGVMLESNQIFARIARLLAPLFQDGTALMRSDPHRFASG